MEVKSQAKYVRVSPRKARVVVDLVRGKSVEQARYHYWKEPSA